MISVGKFLCQRARLDGRRLSLCKFFRDHINLFGLPSSLVCDFEKAYHVNRLATLKAFRHLLNQAAVSRHIEYWHVTLTDDQMYSTFGELAKINGELAFPGAVIADKITDPAELVSTALELRREDQKLKAFFYLKKNEQSFDVVSTAAAESKIFAVYQLLGELAVDLNRSNEAITYKSLALKFLDTVTSESFQMLYDIVCLHMLRNDLSGADQYIQRGLDEARQFDDDKWGLEFRRWQAWGYGIRADYTGAMDILNSILEDPAMAGIPALEVKVHNDIGAITWRRGNYAVAKKHYLTSIRMAKHHGLVAAGTPATVNLMALLFDLAHYRESIRYAKEAIIALDQQDNAVKLTPLILTVFHCYVRLGDYSRAEYWLHRYWANAVRQLDSGFFNLYHAYSGWLALNRFEFKEAEEYYYRAVELLSDQSTSIHLGNVYQSLGEISFYRGRTGECRKFAAKAHDIFQKLDNPTSLAELASIVEICDIYTSEKPHLENLKRVLNSLLKNNCHYYAALFLVHILLRYEGGEVKDLVTMAAPLQSLVERSEAPMFIALRLLIDINSEDTFNDISTVKKLKYLYRTLDNSRHHFLNIFVCVKIADLYRHQSKNRLAIHFYRQADSISQRIGNTIAGKIIQTRVMNMRQREPDKNSRGDILFQISTIVKDIHSYEMALDKIIRFAVDETGAERGVLILCSKDSQDMRIKASVNCENADISDVLAISRSIPRTVAESIEPLMIDDATKDKQTKNMESVLMHNIKSVLCLPIGHPNDLQGILYLDHHTIPALFDSSDMVFVSSMTNFLAIMLRTLESVRVAQSSKARLTSELALLGAGQSFIAADKVSREILDKLSEVARTNANILITGESGTGKEVLCNNIVRLSLRADRPLVKLNCAAIPTSLIESELFGVTKGVATGVEQRKGRFVAADGGTLFLDEVADMPLEIQAKVLRVLEYQQFEPVGSNRTISTDIRFVYATNKDLQSMVREGKFRKDLYYRINTITIDIPPLRERPGDIIALTDHFLKLFSAPAGKAPRLTDDARRALLVYSWPGNARELRNLIEKLCILSPGKVIHADDLPQETILGLSADEAAKATAATMEQVRIRDLLLTHNWNQSKTARIMNMPLSTLRRKIKKYDIHR